MVVTVRKGKISVKNSHRSYKETQVHCHWQFNHQFHGGQMKKQKRLLKKSEEDKIDPPIHTKYFLSGGTTTLIFIVHGANAVNSFVKRSPTL